MDLAAALLAPFVQLRRHLLWVALLLGATVALSVLGPTLQVSLSLPNTPATNILLTLASKLPLALYFMPRLLLCLDAELRDRPENPATSWGETFERRWLSACTAIVLVSLVVTAGIVPFVLPGLVILFLLGWMPLRVLLRGEGLREAARNSMLFSIQNRLGMLAVGAFLALLYFAVMLAMLLILVLEAPDPTPLELMTRPLFWAAYAVGGATDLGLCLAFLGLFHHFEARSDATSRNTPEAP